MKLAGNVLVTGLLFAVGCVSAAECDSYCWLAAANEASLVMLTEQSIVPRDEAAKIAAALEHAAAAEAAPDAQRSGNYLYLERAMSARIGTLASKIHIGRSRQDLHSTVRRLRLRDEFLDTYEAQLAARKALIATAERYADVVIPAYTHGVQAQPTSAGHYLLAFAAVMERDAERYREAYARINRSPLGAAALGTSGFALDRPRLAELLGFAEPVDNSYDANLLSSVDSKLEVAAVVRTGAVPIGQLMQNVHTQYHVPQPWILLADGQTSGSTIMPQKRNPRPLDQVRLKASHVIGLAQQVDLNAHNTNTGMHDYRAANTVLDMLAAARRMYRQYADVVGGLRIDRERASRELARDYAAMTEVADVLQREAGVNFRDGHHYASRLTTIGRAAGIGPLEIDDATLTATWHEEFGSELPVSLATIRRAMDPAAIVAARRGLGGPQAAEVARMLLASKARLVADAEWLDERRLAITTASERRRRAFAALR